MRPDYSTNDPKGWCGDPSRGAALGRGDLHAVDRDAPVKLYLRRIHLDAGGYDSNGTYFGHGRPLYWYADADGNVDAMQRADSRELAKSFIRSRYPKARFYR